VFFLGCPLAGAGNHQHNGGGRDGLCLPN
jgi:hypothetical protein